MPLVRCPDCLSAVSDQAPVCPHCGRPLHPRKLPDDLEQLSCALVLEEADFNDPNLAALLGELMGCAEEETATLRGQTPLVVQRALSCAACMETAQRFGRGNSLSVYLDEDGCPRAPLPCPANLFLLAAVCTFAFPPPPLVLENRGRHSDRPRPLESFSSDPGLPLGVCVKPISNHKSGGPDGAAAFMVHYFFQLSTSRFLIKYSAPE